MMSLRTSAAVLATTWLVFGCNGERVTGNSSETENTLAREISVDSLYHGWPPYMLLPTVATLRLDSSHLDFSKLDSAGKHLTIERLDGRALPFETIFWDRAGAKARLRVRLEGTLLLHGSRFRLRWGPQVVGKPNPSAVWDSIPDNYRLYLTSLLVDDFQHGSLQSLLPDTPPWKSLAGSGATISTPKLADAGHGRSGTALTFTYTADALSGKYAGVNVKLSEHPISLRSLDSIELWARGSGRLSVTLDRPEGSTAPKTWARIVIDTAWKRIRVRPQDFDTADGIGGNIGWMRMRDSITHLTLMMEGGKELWVDDIRMYGVDADDLR